MMTLEKLISEKRAEVEALRNSLSLAEVELRAYERAAAIIASAQPAILEPAISRSRHITGAPLMPARQTGHWAALINDIKDIYPEKFTLDEAMLVAEAGGYPINRNAMRSNLANYVNKGIIERLSQGVFRLTPNGESQNISKPAIDATPDFSGAHTNPEQG
jgi:hypothetical protein